jgi:pimeloyl-ACP methyl ester carboxylesterase
MRLDQRVWRVVPLLVTVACEGDLEPAPPAPPAFAPADCPTMAPPGIEVECGTVRVPERPGHPAEVSLAVALIRARGAPPPGQLAAFLAGPPGASGIAYAFYYAGWSLDASLRALLARRTLVAIDLRGTGGSRPDLRCPGLRVAALPETTTALDPGTAAGLDECRARLGGIPLETYGTAQAAGDVEAVRLALGGARWDLIGIDYGARVALEVIRRHTGGVRAAVLDSAVPPDADLLAEEGPNAAHALERLAARCAASPDCQNSHPDPLGVLAGLITRLDAAPVEVSTHGGSVRLTGAALSRAVLQELQEPGGASRLPARLAEADAGSYGYFAAVLGAPRGEGSLGLHLSVMCSEALPRSSRAAIESWPATLSPVLRPALAARFYALACPLWPIPAAAATLALPVRGPTPVMVLAGGHDPLTAPGWPAAVAAGFSTGGIVPFSDMGHGLLRSPCPAAVAATFLEDPTRTPVPACED